MSRNRRTTLVAFEALSVEGSLIAPTMMAKIGARRAGGQTESDYRIPRGLTLRDEIARHFRIAQALFADLKASPTPSAAATITFVEALLRDVFGFTDIRPLCANDSETGPGVEFNLEGADGDMSWSCQ